MRTWRRCRRRSFGTTCSTPPTLRAVPKARVFAAVLGITRTDWQYLRRQLLTGVRTAPAQLRATTQWARSTTSPSTSPDPPGACTASAPGGSSGPARTNRSCSPPTLTFPSRAGHGTLVTTMATIHEFDTVTLRHAHGRWLPGTTGAVLETFGQDAALVELVGPDGASLDMLTVPLADLDPVQPSAAPHGPGPDRLAG
jgi:hypothetical protein